METSRRWFMSFGLKLPPREREKKITNKLMKGFYVLLTSGWEERKFG
ncbi:MAG: hypothetical protein ACTS4Z_00310 [Candidatus Hodgkinia cicadicola]